MDLSTKSSPNNGGSQSDKSTPIAEETLSIADLSAWNDADLIEACLADNEQAWTVLIERYSRLIYTIPLRFGLPKPVADEIFQETCLILLEKLDTLRDRRRIGSWLVTISRRACIQRWRRKPIQTIGPPVSNNEVHNTEDELLRIEQQHLVHRALENLEPRCQRLLKSLFFKVPSPSYEAIAESMKIPKGSIGPTRARCLEKLRRQIIKLEQDGSRQK
jgi:RNA polymerase sigma factor (sigma-70 family)